MLLSLAFWIRQVPHCRSSFVWRQVLGSLCIRWHVGDEVQYLQGWRLSDGLRLVGICRYLSIALCPTGLWTYEGWKAGNLTRCMSAPGYSLLSSPRSGLCSFWKWLILAFFAPACPIATEFQVIVRAITLSQTYAEAPGLVETEEGCFICCAGWRFAPVAERQVCSVLGRAVPSEPRADRLVTGTQSGTGMLHTEIGEVTGNEGQEPSALGESFEATPMVLQIRAHLDSVKRLLSGDLYIGRGSRQRSLGKSRQCNTFKVAEKRQSLVSETRSFWTEVCFSRCGRYLASDQFATVCRPADKCHGDVLIEEFRNSHPDAYHRATGGGAPPEPGVLSFMARLREEPASDDGSSLDEGVPSKSTGHCGAGHSMKVGVRYTQRDFCDGQSLASPGRWPPVSRVCPSTNHWNLAVDCFRRFTQHHGTEELLVSLAMEKIEQCPFPPEDVADLERVIIKVAADGGFPMRKKAGDRVNVPMDFRFLDVLLRLADDPEIGLGEYAQGVRVGPGTRMPRLPALYKPKKKWRLASQVDPLDYLEL